MYLDCIITSIIDLCASIPSRQISKLESDNGSGQVSEGQSVNSCSAVTVHWHLYLLKLCKSFNFFLMNLEKCPLAPSSLLISRDVTFFSSNPQENTVYCKLHKNLADQVNKNSSSRCTNEMVSNFNSPTILEKQLMQKGYCTQKD